MRTSEILKRELEKLEIESKEILNDIKNMIPNEDLEINVGEAFKGIQITITDPKTMWGREYYTITFNKNNYDINHSTGGWNDVSTDEKIDTILKISKILEFIKNNKEKFFNATKKFLDLKSKYFELYDEYKKALDREFDKEMIEKGFKKYDEKTLRKLLTKLLNNEIEVQIADPRDKKTKIVKLRVTKENNRYRVYLFNDKYSLNDFIRFFKDYYFKGLN